MEPMIEVVNPEDESVLVDDAADTGDAGADEPAAEQAPEADEPAQPAPEPVQWDGDPSTLPETLKPVHQQMVQGMNKKFREIAELRKQYEAKLEELAKHPQTEPQRTKDPAPRLDTSSDEAYQASLERWVEWKLEQREKARAADPQAQQALAAVQTMQEQMEQAKLQQMWLTEAAPYKESPAVEQRAAWLVQNDGFWSNVPIMPESVKRLFAQAASDVRASQKAQQDAKQKATAAQRATARPGGAGVTKQATPADKYAGTFEQIGRKVLDDFGVDPREHLPWD